MFIVIAGCGRLGGKLATELSVEGHDVVVIDRDPSSFSRLGAEFGGITTVGTAIDEDVLREANITQAAVFVAATNSDATNIMAAQVASRLFSVPKVIARISDSQLDDDYQDCGFHTICPPDWGIYQAKSLVLADEVRRLVPLGDGVELFLVTADPTWSALTVEKASNHSGLLVVAIIRQGRTTLAQLQDKIQPGDELLVAGEFAAVERIRQHLPTHKG